MAATTLSDGALNRTVLARQLLLDRSRLSLPRALERVGGIQDQYAPTAYIGLWSRLEDFRRQGLTRALERKSVIQGTLMRGTIHVVSARDYPLLAEGVREARRNWWLPLSRSRRLDVDYAEMAAATDRLLADGPLRRKELVEGLERAGFPREAFEGVAFWIDLIRVPPSGTWERRRADLYQTAERWWDKRSVEAEAGLRHLVARYLGAFGPATPASIGSWAGTPVEMLMPYVEQLKVRRFHTEDGTELMDLPRRRIVPADAVAPVRFLGPWEAVLLTHARRSGVLPEEYRPLVFSNKNPHSVGTFLVDGRVAGSWRQEGGEVRTEPFAPVPRRWKQDLEEERRALQAFMA